MKKRSLYFLICFLLSITSSSQQIVSYQYWYDNNYAGVTIVNGNFGNNFNFQENFNVSQLRDGLHTLNFTFKNELNLWSNISSTFFYKLSNPNPEISKYQYWFDNNIQDSITVNITSTNNLNLISSLDVQILSKGLHTFNIRFKSIDNKWSIINSDFFYASPHDFDSNSGIQALRYWFDNNSTNQKDILIGNINGDISASLNVESLQLGSRQISYQFKDARGLWSSVLTDSFIRVPITNVISPFPQIYLNKTSLNLNDSLQITGNNFTFSGQVLLSITELYSGNKVVDSLIAATTVGNILYKFKPASTLIKGDYEVKAINLNTFKSTDARRVTINGLPRPENKLVITGPAGSFNYSVNKPLEIKWQEKCDNKSTITFTGQSYSNYKIEMQFNNGSWSEITTVFKLGAWGQVNYYSLRYIPANTGNYKFRITNLTLPSRVAMSSQINVINNVTGADVLFVWDYSGNVPPQPPIGACADGTSRILLNILKQPGNTRNISRVDVQLTDGVSNSAIKLGKLKAAINHTSYSLEANDANQISLSLTNTTPDNIWIWYVAPDDYARNSSDNYSPQRIVNAEFMITYTDNSSELIIKPIEIRRPPIMLVHGLGGGPETWNNFAFLDQNSQIKYFIIDSAILGTTVKPVSMIPDASFVKNARRLLNLKESNVFDERITDNSFQSLLLTRRNQQYACNRVDYICHSMGGSMGRSAINSFPGAYMTAIPGNYPFKNYERGFINKFISIETPHNGSPLADLAKKLSLNSLWANHILPWKAKGNPLAKYFWNIDPNNNYTSITNAVSDLQFQDGGVRFTKTEVKNHLIAAINDSYLANCNTVYDKMKKDENLSFLPKMYNFYILNPFEHGCGEVNTYFLNKYSIDDFLGQSDAIVPINSQLPGKNINSLDNTFTKELGFEYNHLRSTKNIDIGNKVFDLLNTSISSSYFADTIARNTQPGGIIQRVNSIDSVIYRVDTSHIKIVSPAFNTTYLYDSTISVRINLKDTNSYLQSRVGFQGDIYSSVSKISDQTFNIQVNPITKDKIYIMASAIYDSSQVKIIYTDTVSVKIIQHDTLSGFKVEPNSVVLNPGQVYYPTLMSVHNNQVGYLAYLDTSLIRFVRDTNVVRFDLSGMLIAKDTGTTYVTYTYKGFKDTLVINIIQEETGFRSTCHNDTISFYCGMSDTSFSYQWQVDSGTGYSNLVNNSNYSGVTNNTLLINSPPTSWYGYKYRCIATKSPGVIISDEFIIKFQQTWNGSSDSAWENPSNWSCNSVPDENTDVYVNSGSLRYPHVHSTVSCRSLHLQPGTSLEVKTGNTINITGNDQ